MELAVGRHKKLATSQTKSEANQTESMTVYVLGQQRHLGKIMLLCWWELSVVLTLKWYTSLLFFFFWIHIFIEAAWQRCDHSSTQTLTVRASRWITRAELFSKWDASWTFLTGKGNPSYAGCLIHADQRAVRCRGRKSLARGFEETEPLLRASLRLLNAIHPGGEAGWPSARRFWFQSKARVGAWGWGEFYKWLILTQAPKIRIKGDNTMQNKWEII